MLKLSTALLTLGLLAASGEEPGVRYIPHAFTDCNSAAFYATAHPTVGRYQYRISGTFVHAQVRHVKGLGYQGEGSVRYALLRTDTMMILPQWTWPHMTPVQRADMAAFIEALRNHELGHKEIADRELAGHDSRLLVVGASPAEIGRLMNAALGRQLRALYDEMQRAEIEYDRVTEHGLRQGDGPLYGFRGGQRVVFICR